MSSLDKFRPVIAFDVDGVLRVRENPEQDLLSLPITMARDEYPKLFHGQPNWDDNGEWTGINHFSKAGLGLLEEVSKDDSFDVFWATTWQHWANLYFGKALGITELPVAVKTLHPEDRNWYHCSHGWKSAQLSEQFNGRPLLWLDDSLPDRPEEELVKARRPLDRALTSHYAVNSWTGLTMTDVETVREWLTLATTEEGHGELRRRRAVQEAKKRAGYERWKRARARGNSHFDIVKERAIELFPTNEKLARELGSAAQLREGLTEANVGYALKRNGVEADAAAVSSQLRILGYHRRWAKPEEDADEDYDF